MKQRTRQTISIFWRHTKRYPWLLIAMLVALIGTASTSLYLPFLYKRFFDVLSLGYSEEVGALVRILISILIINGIGWVAYRLAELSNNFLQPRVMADLQNTCYNHIIRHSHKFFSDNFVGSLVRRVNKYVRAYEDITNQLYWSSGKTLLYISVITVTLLSYKPVVGIIVIVWVMFYLTSSFFYAKWTMKYNTQRADADTKTSSHLADTFSNNYTIRLFATEDREARQYKKLSNDLFRLRRHAWNLRSYSNAVQGLLMIVLEFAVFYVAVMYWKEGLVTIGDFALIQAYLITLFNQLWNMGRDVQRVYESFADAEEMTEILNAEHEVRDAPGAGALRVPKGQIVYDGVTFGYGDAKPVFENFNINIRPGERVAIIGPSGGGKSSFVKLLFRFMEVKSGRIMIDNHDISKVTQTSLRKNISLVPQEPILFHRSLLDNIRYGKPSATRKDVIRVAKLAHCHEFISRLPNGYDTFVGERGVKLSGGERQRVAIARAMLEDAPILVLDEATSSLDSESEKFIQDSLDKLMQGKTTIVIAHRLSTIMKMDRIIVIENGKITEEGKHEELVKAKNGIYQKLWNIQAGGFGS